jgi:protein-L-isoaspartate(D-aspartate) O-methyltransferase
MMTLEDCRAFYAQEVRWVANVSSQALIDAYGRVPREKYLGPPPWQIASADMRALAFLGTGSTAQRKAVEPRDAAKQGPASTGRPVTAYRTTDDPRDLYHNVVVALDAARDLNNGQPSALALWIEALELKPGDRVYHLGCGVGYYTAIMAEVVGPGGSVAGSEVHTELAARAAANLSGYPNVTVHSGDGAEFDPGPCDAMLINAGVTHPHPLWLERLREGGRLVLPITMAIPQAPSLGKGIMAKITCLGGAYLAEIVSPLAIYSCSSVRDPQLEPILMKALGSGSLFKMKSVRTDPHEPSETCILHRSEVCVSSGEPAAQAIRPERGRVSG